MGAVLVHIKKNLEASYTNQLQKSEMHFAFSRDLDNPQIVIMWTEVSAISRSQTILIGCCYRPPDSPKSFYKELEDVLEKIHGFHLPIILLGDFNAKNKEWFAGDSANHHGRY